MPRKLHAPMNLLWSYRMDIVPILAKEVPAYLEVKTKNSYRENTLGKSETASNG